MIRNLYVIRHGEAEHLVGEKLTGGWTDSNLTDSGKLQAVAVGKKLLNLLEGIEFSLYCSDLSRAQQTADIICEQLSIKPIPSKNLRELNNGDAANLTSSEASKISLPVTEPIMDWIHYPNAESWRNMTERVFEFMNEINREEVENIVIVSHRGIIITIIDWWLELNEEYINKISYDIEPCSISHLRINKWGEKAISKLNDTSHLYLIS